MDAAIMENRLERGLRKLKEIDGEQGDRIVAGLRDIAPDFARYLIEFPFGDIFARPGLDLRTREIATVAALTAMGTAPSQLKVHIHGALNVGCTPTKTLVASAYAAHVARRGADYGFSTGGEVKVDMKRVKARKDYVAGLSNRGVERSLKKLENCRVYEGHARFVSPREIQIGT